MLCHQGLNDFHDFLLLTSRKLRNSSENLASLACRPIIALFMSCLAQQLINRNFQGIRQRCQLFGA